MSSKCHRSFQRMVLQAETLKTKSAKLTTLVALGLIPLTMGVVPAVALFSTAPLTLAQAATQAVRSPVQIFVVNPRTGNDTSGNGSETTPFKTVTHALRLAQPNTVILLAPATYSAETGESFPLMLKTGVTLQGNPRTRGQDIVIKGGGSYMSTAAGSQNIAIVGADRAGVTGLTVTNPNPRGYGLWIESGSLVVVDNTFTGSSQDGVAVQGNSATLIRSNYFYDNGGNGISIAGTSRPEVRDNVLANKGFGISIAENAAPKLTGNRISNNRDGVVVDANAQPMLRNNIIENNQRYGLVAIARSRPDLGTQVEPGGNVFRGNGQFDISNQATNQSIPAFGNQLSDRTEGRIDLAGELSPANPTSEPTVATRPSIAPSPTSSVRPISGEGTAQSLAGSQSTTASVPRQPLSPVQPAVTPRQTPNNASLPAISASSFPIPASLSPQIPASASSNANTETTSVASASPQTPAIENSRTLPPLTFEAPLSGTQNPPTSEPSLNPTPVASPQTGTISIPVPSPVAPSGQPIIPPPVSSGGTSQLSSLDSRPLPSLENFNNPPANLLPNLNSSSPVVIPNSSRTPIIPDNRPPVIAAPTQSTGLRYRVLVEAGSESQQALVRSLIPGAFRTVVNGRTLMQVGAYSRRDRADQMLQMLASKGLKAAIDPIK